MRRARASWRRARVRARSGRPDTRPSGLAEALDGLRVAYFLVHMIGGDDDYPAIERDAARRFARAGEARRGPARHLPRRARRPGGRPAPLQPATRPRARSPTEGPPLTYFRAAMVIGPGSESYELLRGIVERLPVLPAPEWLERRPSRSESGDVVDYLREALDVPETAGREIRDRRTRGGQHLDLVNGWRGARASAAASDPDVGTDRAPGAGRRRRRRGDLRRRRRSPRRSASGSTTPTVVTDPRGARLFDIRPRRLDAVLARGGRRGTRDRLNEPAAVSESIVLPASPERVWETVMDPSRLGDWVTTHDRVEDATPPGRLVGGRRRSRSGCGWPGSRSRSDWRVVEAEAPRLARLGGRRPGRLDRQGRAIGSSRPATARGSSTRTSSRSPAACSARPRAARSSAAPGRREARRSLREPARLLDVEGATRIAARPGTRRGGRDEGRSLRWRSG